MITRLLVVTSLMSISSYNKILIEAYKPVRIVWFSFIHSLSTSRRLLMFIVYIFIVIGGIDTRNNDRSSEYDADWRGNQASKLIMRNHSLFGNNFFSMLFSFSYVLAHVNSRTILERSFTIRTDLVGGRVWKMLGIKSKRWATIWWPYVIDIQKAYICWAIRRVVSLLAAFSKRSPITMWSTSYHSVRHRLANSEVSRFKTLRIQSLFYLGVLVAEFLHLIFPHLVAQTAYTLFYSYVGQHTSVGNYWNDPHEQNLYYEYSSFLPYINNEIKSDNSTRFRGNLLRVKKMILIGGPNDGVITPWQSR